MTCIIRDGEGNVVGMTTENNKRSQLFDELNRKTPEIAQDAYAISQSMEFKDEVVKPQIMQHRARFQVPLTERGKEVVRSIREERVRIENEVREQGVQNLDQASKEVKNSPVKTSISKSKNPSFDSMLDFSTIGGVLEIGRIKGRDIYSILYLKVDESYRRQGVASKLLKEALNKTNGNLSGQASNDAAVELNYKLGMRAYKAEKELSLEETKTERAKSSGESIRMILPESMRGENYKPFATNTSLTPNRDVQVYITPATVRNFNEETLRLKELTDEYNNVAKEISQGNLENQEKFTNLQNEILDTYQEHIKEKVSKIRGVNVNFNQPYLGSWEGKYEPSLNMTLSISPNADTGAISGLLFDIAENTSQDAFILEERSEIEGRTPLTEFDEAGMMHYPQIRVIFDRQLTVPEKSIVAQRLKSKGIDDFSIDGDYFIVSIIDFKSETNEQKKEFYAEKHAAITTPFRGDGERVGANRVKDIQKHIRKSKYVGARNEGDEQSQTREYDRSDLFEAQSPNIRYQTTGEQGSQNLDQESKAFNEVVNQLNKTFPNIKVHHLNSEQIDNKLKELGVSEEVRKQVVAWHGTVKNIEDNRLSVDSSKNFGELLSGLYFGERRVSQSFAGITPFGDIQETSKIFKVKIDDSTFPVIDMRGESPTTDEALQKILSQKEYKYLLDKKRRGEIKGIRFINAVEHLYGESSSPTQYVVFDESVIENIKVYEGELLRSIIDPLFQKGIEVTVNGFVHNGEVYLNTDNLNPETPIHEFAHIYNSWLKDNRPYTYQKGIELIKEELTKENSEIKSVIDYVKETQPNLKGETLYEEILAQLIGERGVELINRNKKGGIVEWIKNVWDEIRNLLGLSSLSIEQVANLTVQDFAEMAATDLLKGEELKFENEAQEYFTREADRLPITLAVFNTKPFQDLQGKQVKPVTIQQLLNKSGIKQIEKDLINQVLSDNYSGQKRINYDEFEATVRANIMPLERITTSSYAYYGMDNLGYGNYGEARTLILNSPIEHGVTGHFPGAFRASGRKNIKYVPKQLNDNTWVAVEEGYERQANENNIYQFVGTAGTKEAVDAWIESYNNGISIGDTVQVAHSDFGREYGVVKDINGDKYNIEVNGEMYNNIGRDSIYGTENKAINKGMFGHIRVWQDGQDFYVAELQSDYFQKNNAKQNIKLKVDYSKLDSDFYKKVRNAYERLGYTYNKKTGEVKNPNNEVLDEFVPDDDFMVIASMEIDNNSEILEVKKKLQDTYKKDRIRLEEEALKNRPLQEKQFIASQKIWEQRMVREAIKEASLSGATSLRFPTPYTLSVIEGYISGNEATETPPYQILEGSSDSLKEGDVVNYLDKEYIIVEANENTIKIVDKVQDDITQEIIDDIILAKGSEQFIKENKINDDIYIYRGFHFGDKALYVEKVKKPDDFETNDKYFEEGLFESQNLTRYSYFEKYREEIEDVVGKMSDKEFLEFIEDTDILQQEKVNLSVENASKDFNGQFELPEYSPTIEEILEEDVLNYTSSYKVINNRVYSTEFEETLKQPDKYTSQKSDGFDIDTMLSKEEQTVARKYEQIAEILKQERGEENVEVVTDENGFDWYETKITPEDSQQPVVAFQIKSATDNVGTFSSESNDIRYQILGEKGAEALDRQYEATHRIDNLNVAREMEKSDKDAITIRQATGWERGADGLWRYEIEDGTVKNIEIEYNHNDDLIGEKVSKHKLTDILINPKLYEAYPKLKNTEVIVYKTNNDLLNESKMFTYSGENIYINEKYLPEDNDITKVHSSLLHEVQHLIQIIEGFAKGTPTSWVEQRIREDINIIRDVFENGTSPEGVRGEFARGFKRVLESITGSEERAKALVLKGDFEKTIPFVANYIYMNMQGEVEARNVQRRIGMSEAERLKTLLAETEDMSREDQIFIQTNLGDIFQTTGTEVADSNHKLTTNVVEVNGFRTIQLLRGDKLLGYIRTQPFEDGVEIERSLLTEGTQRGQGIGTKMYKLAIQDAIERGLPIYSDHSQTEAAKGVWNKLVEEGLAEFDTNTERFKVSPLPKSLDNNGEPSAKDVYEYINRKNSEGVKVTPQDRVNIIKSMVGFNSTDELLAMLKDAFLPEGYFKPTIKSLTENGYSQAEAHNILRNQEVQEQVLDIIEKIEALPNTIEFDTDAVPDIDFVTLTTNSIGKMQNENPFKVMEELVEKLGGIKDETLYNDKVNEEGLEIAKGMFEEFSQYNTIEVMEFNEEGELVNKPKNNTFEVLNETMTEDENGTLTTSINNLLIYDDIVLETERELTNILLDNIVKDAIEVGVDLTGLVDISETVPMSETKMFLFNIIRTINGDISIMEFSEYYNEYFNIDVTEVKTEKHKNIPENHVIIKDKNKTAYQMFVDHGLLYMGNNEYKKVNNRQEASTLYDAMATRPEMFPQNIFEGIDISNESAVREAIVDYVHERINSIESDNLEMSEEYILNQIFFEGTLNHEVFARDINVIENTEYLTSTFIADFYKEMLREKYKQSDKYEDYYDNFEITKNGIEIKRTDPISVAIMEEYMNQNIRDYFALKKDHVPDIVREYSEEVDRNVYMNFPQLLEKTTKTYNIEKNGLISIENTNEPFIRTREGLFELVDVVGNTSYYARLPINDSPYIKIIEPVLDRIDIDHKTEAIEEIDVQIESEYNNTNAKEQLECS